MRLRPSYLKLNDDEPPKWIKFIVLLVLLIVAWRLLL